MRLDSAKTSTGKTPFIRLSRLVCANRYVVLAIDTAPVLVNNKKSQSANAATSMFTRRNSAPELAAGSTQIPTWIKKEMEEGEYISYNQLVEVILLKVTEEFRAPAVRL